MPEIEYIVGEIISLAGNRRIIIEFPEHIKVKNPFGDIGIKKIKLSYESYTRKFGEWAEKNPYDDGLIGKHIKVPRRVLQNIADKMRETQLGLNFKERE